MTARRRAFAGGKTTSPRGLSDTELTMRRTLVFRLRVEGCTFREIARRISEGVETAGGQVVRFDLSSSNAQRDFWIVMQEAGFVLSPEEVETFRRRESARLSLVRGSVESRLARQGWRSARDVHALVRLVEVEAKLLGLHDSAGPSTGGGEVGEWHGEDAWVEQVERLASEPTLRLLIDLFRERGFDLVVARPDGSAGPGPSVIREPAVTPTKDTGGDPAAAGPDLEPAAGPRPSVVATGALTALTESRIRL
jgi:hypothetical protein